MAKSLVQLRNRRFQSLKTLDRDLYELKMVPAVHDLTQSIACAFFVLNYSKMFMLRFVYGFLKKYCRPDSYIINYIDTGKKIAKT